MTHSECAISTVGAMETSLINSCKFEVKAGLSTRCFSKATKTTMWVTDPTNHVPNKFKMFMTDFYVCNENVFNVTFFEIAANQVRR